jgi:hypothetical protein
LRKHGPFCSIVEFGFERVSLLELKRAHGGRPGVEFAEPPDILRSCGKRGPRPAER